MFGWWAITAVATNIFLLLKRVCCRQFLTAATLFFLTAPAWAENGESEALAWLQRMVEAAQSQNYDGTFIYRSGDQMESMRVIHRADANGERERLVSLSGVAREVLRTGSQVICILPDNQSIIVGASHPRSRSFPRVSGKGDLFKQSYLLQVSDGQRVAGRNTKTIHMEPRDQYRYGHRLSVDRKSGLLLKTEVVGRKGEVLEQIVYTSLSLPDEIPDSLLEPAIRGEHFKRYTIDDALSKKGAPGLTSWKVKWLPAGFTMGERTQAPIPTRSAPVEHLFYSDGLASFSVYIEKITEVKEPLKGASRMGAMNAFGVVLERSQVTVVGEVPEMTVRTVAESVSPQ